MSESATPTSAPAPAAPVLVHVADHVAYVRLNRPPLHILDVPTNHALAAALRGLAARPDVRVVVLGSAGGRAFSAGVAIEEHTSERVGAMLDAFHGVFRAMVELRAPIVAAVHGPALGGGCELVAFCDAVLAEDGATFGLPEIRLACYPPVAALVLPAVVGRTRAADLILSGEAIDAQTALAAGLVTRLVPAGRLEAELPAFAARFAHHSGAALALAREAVGRGPDFLAALDRAEEAYLTRVMATHDANEAIAAWREKRAPHWEDR